MWVCESLSLFLLCSLLSVTRGTSGPSHACFCIDVTVFVTLCVLENLKDALEGCVTPKAEGMVRSWTGLCGHVCVSTALNLSWFHNAVSIMVKNLIPDLLQNRCCRFWHTSPFPVDTEGSPLLCFLFVYACLTFLMVEHGQGLLSVQQKFQTWGPQTNVWACSVARYKLGHGFCYSFAQLGCESSPLY